MAITATGKFAKRLDETCDLVAQSAAFQTLTGTASAAAAKARTHVLEFNPATATFPLALVAHLSYMATKVTSTFKFDVTDYRIGLLIAMDPPTTNVETAKDEVYSFLNTMSSIHDEMLAALGSDPGAYPAIEGIELDFSAPDPDRAHQGKERYEALFAFDLKGHS